jgi:hypothetical protein
MNRSLFFSVFFLFFLNTLGAQEKIMDLRTNSVLSVKHEELKVKYRTTRVDTIPFSNPFNIVNLPFIDDFKNDGPYPDSSKWINNQVFINRTYPIAPLNYGVATFDGIDKNGYPYDFTASPTTSISCDTLTSKRISMVGVGVPGNQDTAVYLSFYYEAQGRGNAPEPEDSLFLEFHSQVDTVWRQVWSHLGYSANSTKDTNFHQVMILLNRLDTGKYINNPWFQFRFRNFATPCGNIDHWNLDVVKLDHHRSYADTVLFGLAIVYEPLSFLANYQAMPWRQYRGATDMATNAHVFIRNNEALGPRPVTYEYQGSHYGNPFSVPYVGNDPVGPDPYPSFGYDKVAAVADPPVSANGFSFGNTLSDTTVFELNHINHVNIATTETLSVKQRFFNYYAYDDGTAELGYGLEGLGTEAGASLAVGFQTTIADTLKAVQFFWNPILLNVSLDGFHLCVWGPGSGGPGPLLYRSDSMFSPQYMHGYNHFRTYYLNHPLLISGTFYVGWQQYSEDNLSVGFDQNTNGMSHNFFRVDSNSSWQGSIIPGSLMIRPLFGDTIRVNGIQELSQVLQGVNLYPNPAQDNFSLSIPIVNESGSETYRMEILDAYGKQLSENAYIPGQEQDVSALPNGFYFVRITSRSRASCVKKLLIAR